MNVCMYTMLSLSVEKNMYFCIFIYLIVYDRRMLQEANYRDILFDKHDLIANQSDNLK